MTAASRSSPRSSAPQQHGSGDAQARRAIASGAETPTWTARLPKEKPESATATDECDLYWFY